MTAKDEVLKVYPEAVCIQVIQSVDPRHIAEPTSHLYRVYSSGMAIGEGSTRAEAWANALNRIREKQDEV